MSGFTIGDYFLGLGLVINVILAIWGLRRTKVLAETIHELEKNTNSIKDALIKTTAEHEHAKGVLEGKRQLEPK